MALNIFRKAKESEISINDLMLLPRRTQLLIAHFLERNNNDLSILTGDTDINILASLGWLNSMPSDTIGIRCYKFKPNLWSQLNAEKGRFFTDQLLSELKTYRKRNSAVYPWVW